MQRILSATNAHRTPRLTLLSLWLSLGSAACAPATPANEAPPNGAPLIAEVHARKCGSCHSLPLAKTRARPYLEQALGRHHRRVRLTDDEWREMVDYLARPSDVAVQTPR